jgi:cell division protein FtsW
VIGRLVIRQPGAERESETPALHPQRGASVIHLKSTIRNYYVATYTQVRNHKSKIRSQKWRIGALPPFDYPLIVAVGGLVVLGFMLIYSGSYDLALREKDYAAYYLVRQIAFAVFGTVIALFVARSNYLGWRRWSVVLMAGTLATLLVVLLAGSNRYGAQSTLLEGGSAQPSEIAKIVVVLYIADWLSSKGDKLHDAAHGLIPFSIIIGVVTGLILKQPDFGTAFVIVITAVAMFFMAGVDLMQLIVGVLIGGLTITVLMLTTPHTLGRIEPWLNPALMSDQLRQAQLAFKMGGVSGVGLGNGMQRVGFLPLAHTDTVFALAAIELGLIGVCVILGAFVFIAFRGYRSAMRAPNTYGQLLAFGATTLIVVQALINIGAMTGVIPLTGIPLPFVSYGGSSIVEVLLAIAIILSVSRGSRKGSVHGASLDRGRRDRRARVSRAGGR